MSQSKELIPFQLRYEAIEDQKPATDLVRGSQGYLWAWFNWASVSLHIITWTLAKELERFAIWLRKYIEGAL